jgi:cysteine desulfuration protein SufE
MIDSVEDTILQIKNDLDVFDDNMEKYDYIIECGDTLPEMPELYRMDMYQVMGCQSKLWIRDFGDTTLEFKAYSEAKIVRGLAAIVLKIYNGKTKEEILKTDPKVLNNLGIASLLTPGRQNGIGNLIAKIYEITNKRPDN